MASPTPALVHPDQDKTTSQPSPPPKGSQPRLSGMSAPPPCPNLRTYTPIQRTNPPHPTTLQQNSQWQTMIGLVWNHQRQTPQQDASAHGSQQHHSHTTKPDCHTPFTITDTPPQHSTPTYHRHHTTSPTTSTTTQPQHHPTTTHHPQSPTFL